jgi:type IX secretion system PorP/SprF family membrane protein
MNIKLKAFFLFTMTFLLVDQAYAQDPEFTQFYAAPLYTNPAFAGTGACDGGGRVTVNYRQQWATLPGHFVTTAAGWDQHFDAIGGGIGVMFVNDKAGEGLLTYNGISGIYAYQLSVTREFTMRFGIQGTYGQRSIDWDRLRFEDQIDPIKGFVNPTNEPIQDSVVSFANFSAGVLAYTNNFYGGVAVHNIIEPNQSFYGSDEAKIPMRITAHGGLVIPLDGKRRPERTISPNLLFMMQNKFTQMNVGFYMNQGPVVFGAWFRQTFGEFNNSDALMALVGFRKDRFKFGYSYDFTVSGAKSAAPGSHEVSASIEWCAPKRSRSYRKLTCPDF